MDKEKLRQIAIELENAIDAAYENGMLEALDFKPYVEKQIADAKAMKINAPIEFNTHGAYRYWFSETDLGECGAIVSPFVKFELMLTGEDQKPSYKKSMKRMKEIYDELYPPKKG